VEFPSAPTYAVNVARDEAFSELLRDYGHVLSALSARSMDIVIIKINMATYLFRNIPDELWHRVKVRAAIDGQTMRQVLLDALEQYAKDVRLGTVLKVILPGGPLPET
jgi:hypothetical protein